MLVFSVLAGLAALRHSSGIVHVNGTVVPNRADVATAHFCHHAFRRVQRRNGFRRARRTGIAYRVNELVGAWLNRVAERVLYRPSRRRALVAVSEGLANELRDYFPRMADTIRVIPNGVSLDRFKRHLRHRDVIRRQLGIPERALAAIFVGGDWERKGVRFAIEAVVDSPRWHLIVVGEGDPRRYAGICETGNERRIHFVGHVPVADQYLAAGDAFVFPTAYEAFSLSTLEAAAAGLPLLVTPVSGSPELVHEGVSGFLIEQDARLIASYLRRLEDDPAGRQALGAGARRAAEEFRWSRVLERYLDLYDELTATQTREVVA